MNELANSWNLNDQQQIAEALKKLFILQGITKTDKSIDEMSVVFCSELMTKGYAPEQILAALRDLGDCDLKSIKLSNILDAAKKYVHREEEKRIDCNWCQGSGVVLMRTPDSYQFSFACICENSMLFIYQGNKRWNGERFQQGKQGLYEFDHYDECLKV